MTRQWNICPVKLCAEHLAGEWNEAWKVLGSIRSGNVGPVIKQCAYLNLELSSLPERMRDLYHEMRRRGWSPDPDLYDKIPNSLPEIGTVVPSLNKRALALRDCACFAGVGA